VGPVVVESLGDQVFITRLEAPTTGGVRLAVKDCIDVEGVITTAGCPAVAEGAQPAPQDAACLAGARAAGAQIVGKTNLHELCFGATGVNPHYGTPVNPLDPTRIPGGSSSGSAVAVATGQAEVAFGTDTAGSIRNPAACCGVVGLKTTHGRITLEGLWPLAPSMDTVGPLARNVAAVALGMVLLEPGFAPAPRPSPGEVVVGRFRGVDVDPRIDAAVDAALAAAGFVVMPVLLPGWAAADRDGRTLMYAEALAGNAALVAAAGDRLGADVAKRFAGAAEITGDELAAVVDRQTAWRAELTDVLAGVDCVALASYPSFPARLESHDPTSNTAAVAVSFAGAPALSLPIPTSDGPPTVDGTPFPTSLQLVGAWGSEERLVSLGAIVESALLATFGRLNDCGRSEVDLREHVRGADVGEHGPTWAVKATSTAEEAQQ
jgi:amidase